MKYKKRSFFIFVLCVMLLPLLVHAMQNNAPLSGVRIVLDSGHGGNDMGASHGGVEEAPLNLKLTLKLKKELESYGCDVVLTRKDENDLASENSLNRKKDDLRKRISIINDERNDLLVSIHMNKYEDERVRGLHVFYSKQFPSSKILASSIQEAVNLQMNQKKEIKPGDFYILNESRIRGVLIECGFISNSEQRKDLMNESYQNQLVKSIAEGILHYFEAYGYI